MKTTVFFILTVMPFLVHGQTQIFKQDFNSSATLSDYIISTNGGSNSNGNSMTDADKFDLIGNSGTPNSGQTAVVDVASNQLQLVRAQGGSNTVGFYKSGLTGANGLILVSFDLNNLGVPSGSGNYATGNPSTWLQLGSGFANSLTAEIATSATTTPVYAQLGIVNTGNASTPGFSFRYVTNTSTGVSPAGGPFNGASTIKWVINKTASSVAYKSPVDNTTPVTLSANSFDLWITNVGTTTQIVTDVGVFNAVNTITDFKTIFISGNSSQFYDNFSIQTLATDGSAVLPVELTSFTAKTGVNLVNLSWTTASEHNSSHFTITRSLNGKLFETIGKVNAAGHSNTVKQYRFTDYAPAGGINYYQLIQEDLDGKTHTSAIASAEAGITATGMDIESVNAENIALNIYSTKQTSGKVLVSNIAGRQISSGLLQLKQGHNKIVLPAAISPGIVIVTLKTPEKVISKKVAYPGI